MVKADVLSPAYPRQFFAPAQVARRSKVAGHLAPVTWPPILESFSPMRELLSLLDLKKKTRFI